MGDINQSIINPSSDQFSLVKAAIDEYNKKLAKLDRSYKDQHRSLQYSLYRHLQDGQKMLKQTVEDCQKKINTTIEFFKAGAAAERDEDTEIQVLGVNVSQISYECMWVYSLQPLRQKKQQAEADIGELDCLIPLVERFLKLDVLELDIDQIFACTSSEVINNIKSDYKAQQSELRESYHQAVETYIAERNTKVYQHELGYLLQTEGYPLSRASINWLSSRLRAFNLNEADVESREKAVVEPFCKESLEKYKRVYQNKLAQEKFPLSAKSIVELAEIEEQLGLSDFHFLRLEVRAIETALIEPFYKSNFEQYQQIYKQKLDQEGFALSNETIDELNGLEESLGLEDSHFERSSELMALKEALLQPFYQANLQKYQQAYKQKLYQGGIVLGTNRMAELKELANNFGFTPSHLQRLELQEQFLYEVDLLNAEKLGFNRSYYASVA